MIQKCPKCKKWCEAKGSDALDRAKDLDLFKCNGHFVY